MPSDAVATVVALWRYPVKSMMFHEAVDVEEQHRCRAAPSRAVTDGMLQPVGKERATGKPGELVVQGDRTQRASAGFVLRRPCDQQDAPWRTHHLDWAH